MKSYLKLAALIAFLLLALEGCFLFPVGPDGIPWFSPSLEWVKATRGIAMDISSKEVIIIEGNTTVSGELRYTEDTFDKTGNQLYAYTSTEKFGIIRDVIASTIGNSSQDILADIPIDFNSNYSSYFGYSTNPYTKYSTHLAAPAINPYPWSYGTDDLGPSIAKANVYSYEFRSTIYTSYSFWVVGAFTDAFQPHYYGESKKFASSTIGKADCFVVRVGATDTPICNQWGGQENDLAYDVTSDNIGNATIFLRAGSDFGITSATQSLVRMKTGYNIVRLDTNGLLTETFPVSLGATDEISDAQIALGNNGAVYILAKDEQRKQYFLAKVSKQGTAWTRYLPTSVSNRDNTVPTNRAARMGLTVDSKDCAYITGNFSGTVDFGGASLSSGNVQAFVAKYSPNNSCLGALAMGSGLGVTVRLSPDEKSLYVNGWANGSIMGVGIPNQNDERNGVLRPGAFLVKLKIVK
jgi:hypothetical protein